MTILKTTWLLFCVLLNAVSSPYLYHAERFPQIPHTDIMAMMRHNRDYQEHLTKMLNLYPHQTAIADEIREAEQIRLAYDALDDSLRDGPSVCRKREALGKLLNIIGPEAFMRGEMPAYVPIHRFREVR